METTEATTENQLVQIVKESGLAQTKAQVLLENFKDYFAIAAEWEKRAAGLVVTDASQLTEMKRAREGRLFLKDKRVAIEKTRKTLKEDSLREGQTIDAIAKILTNLITPIEKGLEEKEKFAERLEAERKAQLRMERAEQLSKYTNDASIYPLGEMTAAAFDELLTGCRMAHENRIAAEKRAEEERIERERIVKLEQERRLEIAPYAQFMSSSYDLGKMSAVDFTGLMDTLKASAAEYQAEQERIREENARLKAEAEVRERAAAEERAKAEADRKAAEEKARKEREEAEAKAKAEREAAEAAQRVKLEAERKAREQAEAELKAKREAEAKAEADRLAAIEAELSKGDADKFADIITGLTALKSRHTFKSKRFQGKQARVNALIDKIIEDATK